MPLGRRAVNIVDIVYIVTYLVDFVDAHVDVEYLCLLRVDHQPWFLKFSAEFELNAKIFYLKRKFVYTFLQISWLHSLKVKNIIQFFFKKEHTVLKYCIWFTLAFNMEIIVVFWLTLFSSASLMDVLYRRSEGVCICSYGKYSTFSPGEALKSKQKYVELINFIFTCLLIYKISAR